MLGVLLLLGCGAGRTTAPARDVSRLVSMTSLPPLHDNIRTPHLMLDVYFYVLHDGTVSDIKMMNSSGDPEWDRVAVDSMKQWKYAPNTGEYATSGIWLRNTILVQIQDPIIMTIGELVSDNSRTADSLYALLRAGEDFHKLAAQNGSDEPKRAGRFFEAIDLARYPPHVRTELSKLRINDFTRPIRVGDDYVIYKRYENHNVRILIE